ncbi:MAG TPA: HAMP domain-containing sensor histidine kinase [Fodinibius sp.]|nr:HAMP domain-containing sensor histidine kinase [Fodinibius sp.]
MRFVNSYRDFTQIPEPDKRTFQVQKLLKRIKSLNRGEAEARNVNISVDTDPDSLETTADPYLIEQVLINLTKNAFRVLEGVADARVQLIGRFNKDNRAIIEVRDNGPGIEPESQQKIFIPFYSTERPASRGSSGIGLSLSRQIMRKHGGALAVQSDNESGTVFILRF